MFQLRITNPCWYWDDTQDSLGNFNDPWYGEIAAYSNYLYPKTIPDIDTSVLHASQPIVKTWPAFTDKNSLAKGNLDGYSLCGSRTYSYTPHFSWLSMTNPVATPNSNTFSVNSVTPFADEGTYTIYVTGRLASYPNVTAVTTSFTINIDYCLLTAFNAPTLAVQTYAILNLAMSIAIPTYTQVPACQYPVSYTSQIKKTGDANSNRPSLFPDSSNYYAIDSTGVTIIASPLYQLNFIK